MKTRLLPLLVAIAAGSPPGLLLSGSAAAAADRIVSITPDSPAHEVNCYYSPLAHGPTQKFFVFLEAKVVVVVVTGERKAEALATIHVFPETATAEGIDKWINNRHSDALYADAASPERSLQVPAERFRFVAGKPLGHEVGENGDEYDRVEIAFNIDGFTEGDLTVRPSRGVVEAFVRTKDPPGLPLR